MEKRIFLFEAEGQRALGFDTGLNSRSFARAGFAQLICDSGVIARPELSGGGIEPWTPSGVTEQNASMVIWGPAFEGKRLDAIIHDDNNRDAAIAAVVLWIRAVMTADIAVGGTAALWPCAAIIGNANNDNNNVPAALFFAPSGLFHRCMTVELPDSRIYCGEQYVHPDLSGFQAAAFTAGAMLYRVFAGVSPFPSTDEITFRQDMREGNFLPVRLAAAGLDQRLAGTIQAALNVKNTSAGEIDAKKILETFLAVLCSGGVLPFSSFIQPLSPQQSQLLEKEKKQFEKIKTASVKTRRFITRNTAFLLGGLAATVIAALVAFSVINSRAALPTTAGMTPAAVIETYYGAFAALDHTLMEACVTDGAGKDDVGTVVNLFVLSKVRQAYEPNSPPAFIPADEWLQSGGGPVVSGVFGVTDLEMTPAGTDPEGRIFFDAAYTLWTPAPAENALDNDSSANEEAPARMPQPHKRSDSLVLEQKKGNWRITAITRKTEGGEF